VLCTSTNVSSAHREDSIDGFSTYGVRILQPEVGAWLEISARGRTYQPRRRLAEAPAASARLHTFYGNELTEGTIIDLGGVKLLFHGPTHLASLPEV
jgi:hypothetical protein